MRLRMILYWPIAVLTAIPMWWVLRKLDKLLCYLERDGD